MKDTKYAKLAKHMVEYSADVKPGEKVLIEMTGRNDNIAAELIRAVYAAGGKPFYYQTHNRIQSTWLAQADEETIEMQASWDRQRLSEMDAYISIRIIDNLYDYKDIEKNKMDMFNSPYNGPVHFEMRIPNTKWVVTRFPNDSMAQLAEMSTEKFEDFYFDCCCIDYKKFNKLMDPLAELIKKTDKVCIRGASVDLEFSIKDMGVTKCSGTHNLPDGEIFTAPVIESVEGYIQYNTPSSYSGQVFENIRLEFKNGKIIDVKSGKTNNDKLTAIFNTDEGARYIGEFALGLNPYINSPLKDILFDEKVSGSFHFTPGNAYLEADNGNRSSIHWDLVYLTDKDHGGCEIYFDDVLVQKDGLFVLESLKDLNPEYLKKLLAV